MTAPDNTATDSQGWFEEPYYHGSMANRFKVKATVHSEQSPFQRIDVIETEAFGRLLLLDKKTMVSERDEFLYHEAIAHVPAAVAGDATKALVIGGGDGGTVRELARHANLQQIDLVEIDERVVSVSREFFPQCTSALDDDRVRVLAQDGIAFLRNNKNTYDIIIVDSTDPENFAAGLFQTDFYQLVFQGLTEKGVMTAQTETPLFDEYGIRSIYDNLRAVFPLVQSYWTPVSIYPGVFWTFAFVSKERPGQDIHPRKWQEMKDLEKKLQWYNTDWHQKAAFTLSNLQKKLTGVLDD